MEITSSWMYSGLHSSQTSKPDAHQAAGVRSTPAEDGTNTPETQQTTQANEGQVRASASTTTPEGILPLQMYAIPDWMADFGFQLPQKLGVSGNWFAQNNPQAARASQAERAEYHTLVNGHYRDLLDQHGINDTVSHFEFMVNDKTSSEAMRQEMMDRVRSDDRLMDLMAKMGKTHILASQAETQQSDVDVRSATVEEMAALSQHLYDSGRISLQSHAMLSFDPSLGQALPDGGEGNIFMTAPNSRGQYDWISEMTARLDYAQAHGLPSTMLEKTVSDLKTL